MACNCSACRDPITGKRKEHYHTVHETKKDAEKYLTAVVRERDLGIFVEPTSITVEEYLDQWLESAAKPKLGKRTFMEYSDLLKRYVRSAIGHKKLCDIQPLEIQTLYTDLQARGLSARTVRYTHSVLSSALKQAVKWRMLVQNPASLVELPKKAHKEMQALSPEDAAKFLKAAEEDLWGNLFLFALITGMRPSEYLGLQWKDVDLQKGIVTVCRTLVWRSHGLEWYFDEPKTPRSKRSIPIPHSIVRLLREHKRNLNEDRLKLGPDYLNYDLVFATSDGRPLMRHNLIKRHFKPILKRAGLPESIRLYDLRHSCATLLLSENEHPKIVSERLGHANISMTLDTYSHVLPTMQQAASEKLERILFEKVADVMQTK